MGGRRVVFMQAPLSLNTVVPVRSWKPAGGRFHWPARPLLHPGPWRRIGFNQLIEALRRAGVPGAGTGDTDASVRVHESPLVPAGTYRIDISRDGVRISARSEADAYYAVQTIRELIRAGDGSLPAGVIEDSPDFARRGLMYDCSRGKVPTVETVRRLVEHLAHWKVNELQLYIENVFTFRKHPLIGQGYDPFTPDDIRAIQDHCREHHVRLVPTLASFGHFERILAIPEYQHLSELPGFHDYPGGRTLCPTDPGSLKLIEELFDEFVPLFDAADFNVCCDETWELGKGRSKPEADRIGVGRLYLRHLLALHRLCRRHGKRMNAWADIVLKHPELLSEVPKDLVLLNWEYEANGRLIPRTREIADSGLPFCVCPSVCAYQTHSTRLDNAVANIRQFADTGRQLAAEGLLNTDWGDFGHRNTLGVSLCGMAYGAAHGWHGRGVDDQAFFPAFARSLFGPDAAALAGIIRTLGRTYLDAGPKLYHVLVEAVDPVLDLYADVRKPSPVTAHRDWRIGNIEKAPAAGVERALRSLQALTIPPVAPEDPFAATAIDELKLAREMDQLACEKALIVKRLRAGDATARPQAAALADRMERMIPRFEAAWLARNRPSLLHHNRTLLGAAVADLRGV